MQEDSNIEIQSQDNAEPIADQAVVQQPVEKTFTQEQLNAIVGREKQVAAERARRQMAQQAQQQSSQMGGMQQLSQGQIEQLINDKVQNELQQRYQQYEQQNYEAKVGQLVNDFYGKIEAGKQSDPDFEKVFKDVDLTEIADLVPMINSIDNTYAVTRELIENPEKVAQLRTLKDSPKLAMRAIGKLANSLKSNQDALAQRQSINEPLSQITPSPVQADNGSLSIRDLKNASWLRG